jgi:hypothetical protein
LLSKVHYFIAQEINNTEFRTYKKISFESFTTIDSMINDWYIIYNFKFDIISHFINQ